MSAKALFALMCLVGPCAVMCRAQSDTAAVSANSTSDSSGGKEVPIAPVSAPAVTPPDKPSPGLVAPQGIGGPDKVDVLQPAIDPPPTRKPAAQAKAAQDKAVPDKAVTGKSAAVKSTPPTAQYVIGPLDVLMVKVWGQANLTGPVDVGPDGVMSMNLIGEIKADGLTKDQLKAAITERLTEFYNDPQVDVQVLKINSKRYWLYGAVGRQGEVALVKPTTIFDAMSNVGGFSGFAKTNKILIMRTMPSGEIKKFYFNYKQAIKGEHMEQNIFLQDGDRIVVPGE